MLTTSLKDRSPTDVADTDEYNQLQLRRTDRPLGTATVDSLCRPLRVLIVDDHRAAADTLSMLVRIWGHDVRRAYDGLNGLAMATAFVPDVVFVDLVMPDMSGSLLAIKVAQLVQLKDCVVFAVTGSTNELRRQFCQFAGIRAVLLKPVLPSDMKLLLARESEHMRSTQREAAIFARQPGRAKRFAGTPAANPPSLPRADLQQSSVS